MEAKGATGTITYVNGMVTLRRKSFVGGGGEVRTYRLEDIANLDYRAATFVEPGFIRVLGAGGLPARSYAHDRNAVGFRSDQQQEFIEVYRALYRDLYGSEPPDETLTAHTPTWVIALGLVLLLLYIGYVWLPMITS